MIGVSTYLEPVVRWGPWELPAALLPADYHRLVQRAGGTALLLPPDPAPGAARAVVERLDGIVVAGGPDVDPARYGAGRDPRTGPPAPERDAWETALIAAALEADVPLLGVCRGMQLMNVVLGGTLIQHLDGHVGAPGTWEFHPVRPVPGTRLAELLGPGTPEVATHHHQAVDRLAEGLVVGARAADGTVEAVELPSAGFALGVQWHPEAGEDLRLMEELVVRAADRRSGLPRPGGRQRVEEGGAQPSGRLHQ
ncbi:gamma-glutamyl-gamma-aminobutyrate hydrolase family protein [Streptomyces calidiresistens]|uniref:Gamma-glutamyl-gamma-aminobutyrate hydrolase family protein n=1 Tax=Streptomyces calidiresistens TaxID=1485586 RepID=A0A7W3T413_9ACTN|nr:gamma-glutamyl-gamma-aminobutyrate hydrolase family protein [Streptomyces calidiresistens]MBB0230231.1 gamma-glutamyl-gamma-aminobutyrate hydrolase family protein [Streptomyces calidiresistens]